MFHGGTHHGAVDAPHLDYMECRSLQPIIFAMQTRAAAQRHHTFNICKGAQKTRSAGKHGLPKCLHVLGETEEWNVKHSSDGPEAPPYMVSAFGLPTSWK